MTYRSNLAPPPGILERFKHLHRRVEPWSYGTEVISDFADKAGDPRFANHRNCTFLTEPESAILFHCALRIPPGTWLDIGSHSGFSGLTIAAAGHRVISIDPEYAWPEFFERWLENVKVNRPEGVNEHIISCPFKSDEYFEQLDGPMIDGALIDGNHDVPCPLRDAQNCAARAKETAVLIAHDLYGRPIQEAVKWLLQNGWNCKLYRTPNGMAVCSRGDFNPPEHAADPNIPEERIREAINFIYDN